MPVLPCAVAHGARREVDLSGHHADKGERDVVARHVVLGIRPAALFHPKDALIVEDVGIGAVQSYGFINAVKVKHKMVLGGAGSQPLDHLYSGLVITVHEVYFETFDAHVSIMLADRLQVFIHHVEHSP